MGEKTVKYVIKLSRILIFHLPLRAKSMKSVVARTTAIVKILSTFWSAKNAKFSMLAVWPQKMGIIGLGLDAIIIRVCTKSSLNN